MTDDTGPMLDQLNLVVQDMDAAVAFYRHLGLTIDGDGQPWANDHRTVRTSSGVDFDIDGLAFAKVWITANFTGYSQMLLSPPLQFPLLVRYTAVKNERQRDFARPPFRP